MSGTRINAKISMSLRVNKCEVIVLTVRIFMKCTHVCAAETTYIINKT